MRVFLREAPGLEVVVFVFGLLETLVAFGLLAWLRPKLGFDIIIHPPAPSRPLRQQQQQHQPQQQAVGQQGLLDDDQHDPQN